MLRILIEYIVPLCLPTVLWIAWRMWRRDRTVTVPWVWLAAAGALLALVVTWGGWLRSGTQDGTYHPASVGKDGRLIPGRVD